MKLYKLEKSNWGAFYGPRDARLERDDIVRIAQTPNCDAFLFLSKETHEEEGKLLELLNSVPSGYDFTYCQEWGLTVDDDVVDRVIIDLRKKAYPSWEDQLDYIYHNGLTKWKTDMITPVKEKYPKT